MTTKPSYKPWHEVVQLRDGLKTGELLLAVFAADLCDVTYNLREQVSAGRSVINGYV